jgi:hypothetical protein
VCLCLQRQQDANGTVLDAHVRIEDRPAPTEPAPSGTLVRDFDYHLLLLDLHRVGLGNVGTFLVRRGVGG